MARSIRVLIAEDHDVVREGLKILISSDPRLQIAGEAADGRKAVELSRQLKPDVVVMDLAMPGQSGVEAAREICLENPHSKVLVLSASQDEDSVCRVMEAGASGYMTKHSAAGELLAAIQQVVQGKAYFSANIAARMRARERRAFVLGRAQVKPARLTGREAEVLLLIAGGQATKEIAHTLKLSVKTVEKHRQQVMDKLDLHDVASLTRYAVSKGLLGSAFPLAVNSSPMPVPRALSSNL